MHYTVQNLIDIKKSIINILEDKNISKIPKIIAVSKTFSSDKILPLIEYGHIDYGENKVQEAINKWTNSPRTQDPTSSHDHYTIRYSGTESSASSSTITVTYSDAVPYTNFDGVVTFSNGTFKEGTANITTIDGANISTGTIKAAQLEISNLDADPGSGSTADGIFLDGTNNNIKIFAGGALRVKIGDLS